MNLATDDRLENIMPYWFDRFFTDHYQHYDTTLEGVVPYVKELYAAGAYIVYLTGRDAPGMLVGAVNPCVGMVSRWVLFGLSSL